MAEKNDKFGKFDFSEVSDYVRGDISEKIDNPEDSDKVEYEQDDAEAIFAEQKKYKKKSIGLGSFILTAVITFVVSLVFAAVLFSEYLPKYLETNGYEKKINVVENDPPTKQIIIVDEGTSTPILAIAEKASQSIVRVVTEYRNQFSWDQSQIVYSTGIVIRKDGFILASYSSIAGALSSSPLSIKRDASIKIQLQGSDELINAKIIGFDATTNVAVLKIDMIRLTPVEIIEDYTADIGDFSVAIGKTLAVDSEYPSAIAGYIGGYGEYMDLDYNVYELNFIAGTSFAGGGLFNSTGELIGVIKAPSTNITYDTYASYAVSIYDVLDAISEYAEYEYATVSTTLEMTYDTTYTAAKASTYGTPQGVFIASVNENGVGNIAGFKPRDIITSINNVKVQNYQEFRREISKHNPGDVITVEVFRYTTEPSGSYITLLVELVPILDN